LICYIVIQGFSFLKGIFTEFSVNAHEEKKRVNVKIQSLSPVVTEPTDLESGKAFSVCQTCGTIE